MGCQIKFEKIHKALSKKESLIIAVLSKIFITKPRHQSDSMFELPPKKPDIREKKPKNQTIFLTPTTSKKKPNLLNLASKKHDLATLAVLSNL